MSIKSELVGWGILGVGAFILITNADKIAAWIAGQFGDVTKTVTTIYEDVHKTVYDTGFDWGQKTKEGILDPIEEAGQQAGYFTQQEIVKPFYDFGVLVGSTQATVTNLGSNLLNNVFTGVYNWFDWTGKVGAAALTTALTGSRPELVTTVAAQEIPEAQIAPTISNTAVIQEWIPKILAEGEGKLGTVGGVTGIWLNYADSGFINNGSDFWSATSRVQNQPLFNIEDLGDPTIRRALEREIAARGGMIVLSENVV